MYEWNCDEFMVKYYVQSVLSFKLYFETLFQDWSYDVNLTFSPS